MNAMRGCWEMVVEIYKRDPRSYNIKIGVLGDTTLHIAIMSRQEDTAQKLVQLIIYTRTETTLLMSSLHQTIKGIPLSIWKPPSEALTSANLSLTIVTQRMVPLLFKLPLQMAFGVRLLLQLSSSY